MSSAAVPFPVPAGARAAAAPAVETDEALAERVRRGDAAAFDALAARHLRRAFSVAHRLLGNREDAEDLVQDAFVTVLAKIDQYQRGRPFAPWFFRLLVNRGLNARKSRALRATEAVPADAPADGASPERQAERAELRVRLARAMDALPERQRAVVELFELEGFSGAEIAAILEISPGTVRWHLHEARAALRHALAVYDRRSE